MPHPLKQYTGWPLQEASPVLSVDSAVSYSGARLCEGSRPSLMYAHGSGLVVSQFLHLILSF